MNLAASCTRRFEPPITLLICPNVAELPASACGFDRCTVLLVLNASARTWSVHFSIAKSLASDESRFTYAGPTTILRPALPGRVELPAISEGMLNAEVLNHSR